MSNAAMIDESISLESRAVTRSGRVPLWLHTVPHLHQRFGGISTVVPQLTSALSEDHQIDAEIAAFCSAEDAMNPAITDELHVRAWPARHMRWLADETLRTQFVNSLRAADGVHIHGLWQPSTWIAARAARQLRKPYILSAHGMLDAWALQHKRPRKLLYAALTERANVRGAACLHALTHQEAKDYRLFGARQPIAVIPNGVTIPTCVSPGLFLSSYPQLYGRRIVLFLGRLHSKKGVHVLLESWKKLVHRFQDAVLVFAGPDFEGARDTLRETVHRERLEQQVVFSGLLVGAIKWSAFAAASVFVLPSFAEGFSVAVLEAMGMGLPVILSRQCNFPEAARCGAGLEVEPSVHEVSAALEDVLSNSANTNAAIGEQGRRLVERNHSWPRIAQQMAEVYLWTLGGNRPSSTEILEVER